ELPVGVAGRALQRIANFRICGDIDPAQGRNLDEGDLALQFRSGFEQRPIGSEALHQSLAVVEPVDAEQELAPEQTLYETLDLLVVADRLLGLARDQLH